jgi:hypothetical protein
MPSLAVCTITLAKRAEEEALLLRSLATLCNTVQHPVIIADGGSRPEFVEQLRALPRAQVLGPVQGLVPQVHAALAHARDSVPDWILYTEPDKRRFFRKHLACYLQQTAAPPADLIVAARTPAAFRTFPRPQRAIERRFNRLAADILNLPHGADVLYGPLLFRGALLSTALAAAPDLGWGWRIYLLAQARRHGRTIAFHCGPFRCPPSQRRPDPLTEHRHRLKQLADNARGLMLGL